jgi:hypothetical protein
MLDRLLHPVEDPPQGKLDPLEMQPQAVVVLLRERGQEQIGNGKANARHGRPAAMRREYRHLSAARAWRAVAGDEPYLVFGCGAYNER